MDHGGSTKPSATREIDLSPTLTVDFDQFRASVQVKKRDFFPSCHGTIND